MSIVLMELSKPFSKEQQHCIQAISDVLDEAVFGRVTCIEDAVKWLREREDDVAAGRGNACPR